KDQQSRGPSPACALAVLEEAVGGLRVRAGEVGVPSPGSRSAGGEDRGDVQFRLRPQGEVVGGVVQGCVDGGGADARDPAAGAEGGVVLPRGGPGDAEGGGSSIPGDEHDRDPGGQAEQVAGIAVGAADDLTELRGEAGQELWIYAGGVRDGG